MRKRKKEAKSLDLFKKGFRKNEVVIYAIALMLVTAGYFNYTANLDDNVVETYSEGLQNVAKSDENTANITPGENNKEEKEDDDGLNEVSINENKNGQLENNSTNKENTIAVALNNENSEDDEDDIGDAKLVNSNSVVKEKNEQKENNENDNKNKTKQEDNKDNASDYFVASKLQRDTSYADMVSTYTKIIEDGSVSETQKAIAMKEITKITDIKNAISVCENILSTKGFENYVVFVNNESVNVVVQVKDKLSREQVAQIQNIVSRELNSKIDNIHITEK